MSRPGTLTHEQRRALIDAPVISLQKLLNVVPSRSWGGASFEHLVPKQAPGGTFYGDTDNYLDASEAE